MVKNGLPPVFSGTSLRIGSAHTTVQNELSVLTKCFQSVLREVHQQSKLQDYERSPRMTTIRVALDISVRKQIVKLLASRGNLRIQSSSLLPFEVENP